MTDLSRLERVELRDIWKTEDRDFTPWLAQEHNLAVLSTFNFREHYRATRSSA